MLGVPTFSRLRDVRAVACRLVNRMWVESTWWSCWKVFQGAWPYDLLITSTSSVWSKWETLCISILWSLHYLACPLPPPVFRVALCPFTSPFPSFQHLEAVTRLRCGCPDSVSAFFYAHPSSPDVIRLQRELKWYLPSERGALWIIRAHIPEPPATVFTKQPAPQVPPVTKQLSLGSTQGCQKIIACILTSFIQFLTCLQEHGCTIRHCIWENSLRGVRKLLNDDSQRLHMWVMLLMKVMPVTLLHV